MGAILDTRKEIIVGKEKIMRILPHRSDKLLLDRVIIADNKIIGELTVTKQVCEGHAVLDGKLVMRGSDLLDMAAQLLGVWAANKVSFSGKPVVVWKYGGARFREPIYPGELLVLEMEAESAMVRVFGGYQKIIVKGENFLAKVGDKTKAEISSVDLASLN